MKLLLLLALLLAATARAAEVLILTGAPGTEEYGRIFTEAAARWEKGAAAGGASTLRLGEEPSVREALHTALQQHAQGEGELWLVLIGHGTFDGREARFNARGDDFTAAELAAWLQPVHRPLVVVCAFSCSGAFLKPLAAPERVILTATRTGAEENYSRFAQYLSETIADPAADLDGDGQTSLLEAWLAAARRVAAFYQDEGRLATEHSLLDDNGDALGTPPDWFTGLRAVKSSQSKAPLDGLRARQLHLVRSPAENALPPALRAERDQLERDLAALRDRKTAMADDEYYGAIEKLLLQLARLYHVPPGTAAEAK